MKKSNLSKFMLKKVTVSTMQFLNGGASTAARAGRNAAPAGKTPQGSCNGQDDDCDG
ncbi:MAG: hypothetical protein AB8B65_05060 [Kordia sp.]|uniref:hypothetical protein n=1 Tax=Kordia sp. TaxID=1965332 RepID=UPI003858D143